jgi:hypothetical protein
MKTAAAANLQRPPPATCQKDWSCFSHTSSHVRNHAGLHDSSCTRAVLQRAPPPPTLSLLSAGHVDRYHLCLCS